MIVAPGGRWWISAIRLDAVGSISNPRPPSAIALQPSRISAGTSAAVSSAARGPLEVELVLGGAKLIESRDRERSRGGGGIRDRDPHAVLHQRVTELLAEAVVGELANVLTIAAEPSDDPRDVERRTTRDRRDRSRGVDHQVDQRLAGDRDHDGCPRLRPARSSTSRILC
jgi:hypothetical protein